MRRSEATCKHTFQQHAVLLWVDIAEIQLKTYFHPKFLWLCFFNISWQSVFCKVKLSPSTPLPRLTQPEWPLPTLSSARDEIRSAYAQCAIKFALRMLSMYLHVKTVHVLHLAEHALKFIPRMLIAQCALKSLPRMLSMR
jgi:hypothetical protein